MSLLPAGRTPALAFKFDCPETGPLRANGLRSLKMSPGATRFLSARGKQGCIADMIIEVVSYCRVDFIIEGLSKGLGRRAPFPAPQSNIGFSITTAAL